MPDWFIFNITNNKLMEKMNGTTDRVKQRETFTSIVGNKKWESTSLDNKPWNFVQCIHRRSKAAVRKNLRWTLWTLSSCWMLLVINRSQITTPYFNIEQTVEQNRILNVDLTFLTGPLTKQNIFKALRTPFQCCKYFNYSNYID